ITQVSYLGLVIEASTEVLEETSIASFELLHETLKKETEGAAVYQGTYRTADGTPTVLRLLAVTQSLPDRIRQLLGDARREGHVIGTKIQEELPTLELGDIQDVELFRTRARPSERPRRARAAGSRRTVRPIGEVPSAKETHSFPETPPPPKDLEPRLPPPQPLAEPGTPLFSDEVSRPRRIGGRRRPGRGPTTLLPPAETPAQAATPAMPTSEPETADQFAIPASEPAEPLFPGRSNPVETEIPFEADFAPPQAALPSAPAEPAVPEVPLASASPANSIFPEDNPLSSGVPSALGAAFIENAQEKGGSDPVADVEETMRPLDPEAFRQPSEARESDDEEQDVDLMESLQGTAGVSEDGRAASDPGTEQFDLLSHMNGETPEPEVVSPRRPPTLDPDTDTGDLPSPAAYQKMVVDYLAEPFDEARRREIQQRLEDDSVSANSAVRYYAVEAMAQLKSDVFKPALLTATEDEDEAVRMIAIQALRD
ncbi:MAG: hypothetical protein AAF449_24015, partial [Myxococcota bacterium]